MTKLSRSFDGQNQPALNMISYKTLTYLLVNNQQIRGTRVQASVILYVALFLRYILNL